MIQEKTIIEFKLRQLFDAAWLPGVDLTTLPPCLGRAMATDSPAYGYVVSVAEAVINGKAVEVISVMPAGSGAPYGGTTTLPLGVLYNVVTLPHEAVTTVGGGQYLIAPIASQPGAHAMAVSGGLEVSQVVVLDAEASALMAKAIGS